MTLNLLDTHYENIFLILLIIISMFIMEAYLTHFWQYFLNKINHISKDIQTQKIFYLYFQMFKHIIWLTVFVIILGNVLKVFFSMGVGLLFKVLLWNIKKKCSKIFAILWYVGIHSTKKLQGYIQSIVNFFF